MSVTSYVIVILKWFLFFFIIICSFIGLLQNIWPNPIKLSIDYFCLVLSTSKEKEVSYSSSAREKWRRSRSASQHFKIPTWCRIRTSWMWWNYQKISTNTTWQPQWKGSVIGRKPPTGSRSHFHDSHQIRTSIWRWRSHREFFFRQSIFREAIRTSDPATKFSRGKFYFS
jgi:hypothetical protein